MEASKGNRTALYVIGAVFVILIILAFVKGCSGDGETIEVKHPEVNGSTPIEKPEQEPIVVVRDSIVFKYIPADKTKEQYWQNEAKRILEEYNEMDAAFANANDSLQQLLYRQATAPKEFFKEWDNDTLTATVFGLNSGSIHRMQLKYKIKETKTSVKLPQTVFRLLGGIETGMTKDFSKFNAKANIGIQNKKGNILSVGFDTDQRIYLGYSMSIFSIKK